MAPAPKRKKRKARARVAASPLREVLAENIIAARDALGMSQWALAQATGISQNYISRIERCDTNPSLDLIDAIAQQLGLTFVALITPNRKKRR